MELTAAQPPSVARRYPRWWGVVLVQAAGLYVALIAFVGAALLLPRHGLFGVENDLGDRTVGVAAALVCGVGLASGPLLVAAVRRDRRWFRASCAVVVAVAILLVAGAQLTDG